MPLLSSLVNLLDPFQNPLFFTSASLLLLYFTVKFLRNATNSLPPGPIGIPFFGYMPDLGDKPYEFLDTLSQKYGDIFSMRIAGRPYVVLSSYEAIKAAYITNANNFVDRPTEFNIFSFIVDFKAMGILNGEEWRLQRKMFSSAMKFLSHESDTAGRTILEQRIHETGQNMVAEINKSNLKPVDLFSILANSTINVVGTLVCGESLATTRPEVAKSILNDSRAVFGLTPGCDGFLVGTLVKLNFQFSSKRKKILEIRERQFDLAKRFIKEHQSAFDSTNIRDYIDMCLSENQQMDHQSRESEFSALENMTANIFLFYLAGTDTTSTSLYFATYLMAKHPQVQIKCQNELDDIFGPGESINFNDRKRLPYIEAVINEILRYSVIGPLPTPRRSNQATDLLGYKIPALTHVVPNLWSATRDKKHFPNPMQFDPDNFYNRNVPRDLASMPFSAGKRVCPGEGLVRIEFFMFFTTLLKEFTLSFPIGESYPENVLPGFIRGLSPFKIVATPR